MTMMKQTWRWRYIDVINNAILAARPPNQWPGGTKCKSGARGMSASALPLAAGLQGVATLDDILQIPHVPDPLWQSFSGRPEGVGGEVGLPVPGGAQADAHRSWVRGGGMAQKNLGHLQEGAGNGERPSFGGGENIFVADGGL